MKRTETDFLGTVSLPADALYGIHAWRSRQNFPLDSPFDPQWYSAMALVKRACYRCIQSFHRAASKNFPGHRLPAGMEDVQVFAFLEEAAAEMHSGMYMEHFIAPALQGGAGTSINMNVNEILSNVALQKMGLQAGDYGRIDPFRHANLFQSTNDVVPTALKLAVMRLLEGLEDVINGLRSRLEENERAHRNSMRIAHTQMQEALPSSYGMLFGAYNEALSRDWWRISKCFERIKVVNLGGGATGSALAVPRYFVMEAVSHLQQLSNLPITRSENLTDTTQNQDALVEVHGILKAHAVNLEKIATDMRLLSSDMMAQAALSIPQRQAGSSIMPGKVNPVIPEFVISLAHKVYSNDMLLTSLSAQGCTDLNAYLPAIGHAILDSLNSLIAAGKSLSDNLIAGLEVHGRASLEKLMHSPSLTTALIPYIGYGDASRLAGHMKAKACSLPEANDELKLVSRELLADLLRPEKLLKLGYSMKDIQ